MTTLYSDLLRSMQTSAGACSINVPDDWMQGRSVFGGLQAAVLLRAMRTLVPEVPLRCLQTTFVAPVPGGALRARAQVLRAGKSATHVEARIVDGEQTLATAVGVFGVARASVVSVAPQQQAVSSAKPIEFRFLPGLTPNFTQHFPSRWLRGKPPFTGDTVTEQVIDVGLRDGGPATEAHVLALADFIPPVALSLLSKPATGSSMTWMIELLRDRFDDLPLENWRVDATLVAGRDGYTSQSAMIWAPGGVPVALSRQSMVVFG